MRLPTDEIITPWAPMNIMRLSAPDRVLQRPVIKSATNQHNYLPYKIYECRMSFCVYLFVRWLYSNQTLCQCGFD